MSDLNQNENAPAAPEQEPRQAAPSDPPAPPPAPPGGSGQYWSSQDARRAQQGFNTYNGPGTYRQPPYQQRPYEPYNSGYYSASQYNANTGWQQPRTGERNEWSFDDYDHFTGVKKKKRKNHGLVVFAVSVMGVLFVALVALAGLNLYNSMTASDTLNPGADSSSSAPAAADDQAEAFVPRDPGAEMNLASKPQVAEPASVDGRLTIPQVAKKLLPSVVSVENYQNGQLFEAAALGSGIIMNEEGYLITNHHVVADAVALKVTLDDGTPYEAKLVGSDARTDLAVLKIEASDLTPAEFGDSTQLDVGETVIAIGNPASMQLKGSVTQGIVSAVNRTVIAGDYSMTFIQTDAAINPGNSGGALANEFGQVVGINSSKIVQEGFEGIGFAIPISDAKPIIDDLVNYGRVKGRVMLGITAYPVDEITARNYDVPMGLMIREITPGSDLAAKGAQARDIITHINGERVFNFNDLRAELDNFKVGDRVQLTLFRQSSVTQGTTFDITITLMEDVG